LTPREREIAALLARGWSNRRIAEELSISEHTVRTHVTAILGKLGLTGRAQVALWAVAQGLVAPPRAG
jgi:DNA-binding NarL/FixJ family response regulator